MMGPFFFFSVQTKCGFASNFVKNKGKQNRRVHEEDEGFPSPCGSKKYKRELLRTREEHVLSAVWSVSF